MKLPQYGSVLRSAFDGAGLDVQSRDVVAALRESAAEIGAAAADIFAAEMPTHTNAPADALELARLAVCSEVERAVRSVLAEWAIPRSANTESLVELAGAAFTARLSALSSSGGAQ